MKRNILIITFVLFVLVINMAYASVYTDKKGFALDVPSGWQVSTSGDAVYVYANQDTFVLLWPLMTDNQELNAVSLLSWLYNQAKQKCKDLKILDKKMSADGTEAKLNVQYTSPQTGNKVMGMYLCKLKNGFGTLCGHESPVNYFQQNEQVFKQVLYSFRYDPKTFFAQRMQQTSNQQGQVSQQQVQNYISQPVQRSSMEGASYGMVPADWEFGGGLNSQFIVAHNHTGDIGVSERLITGGYNGPPGDILLKNQSQIPLGNLQVLGRQPFQYIKDMAVKLNVNMDGEIIDVQGTAQNGKLTRTTFYVMVLNAGPGSVISIKSVWAPAEIFNTVKPTLEQIVFSLGPDQSVVQQNLANIRAYGQISKTISQTGDIVIATVDQNMENTNRWMDKVNLYYSGEQAYYSQTENKVYVGQADWGEYIQNPNYPQETMTTNVPDYLWNKIPQDRTLLSP